RGTWTALELPGPAHGFVYAMGEAFASTDPATRETVATVASSTPGDIDAAIGAAVHAWKTTGWPSNGEARAQVLYSFAKALRTNEDRLAELLTREQGKTIHEARVEISG